MARVQADTLKTRSGGGATAPKRGRRPVNGNSAQGAPPDEDPPVDEESPPADEPEPDEAATDEVEAPPPPPKAARSTAAASPPRQGTRAYAELPMAQQADADQAAHSEDQELLALGKLTRFALENGLTVEDCVERFRNMVAAYDAYVAR